ncbi:sn-glycerol-3-phosphate transport system permease protein UgpE [Tistrella bauzanensis]|uniref:sn-glycerol-3-phosphate transport system permease protein UgpE n=2 Tax=Tistrella bauzanensis TaxID=657419 RepID=A0ABQ1J4P1_9PROT|nr:sn-glycerol-3-phosphate ABC transporter permease UgpE [Tistrella bauzanensis]GGB59856.1 sn-glycerol-3-phosphate transport system permease protein UgpE [Tistrella bauzanensis]
MAMVEGTARSRLIRHALIMIGLATIAFPVYMALVTSTHEAATMVRGVVPLLPGTELVDTYSRVLATGIPTFGSMSVLAMLGNSLVMALGIAIGKIVISLLSAYAIVFFRFPLRTLWFWMIFATLMLPVEVRIVPTFQVVADLGLLNSYGGLVVPLLASATATFLFRQFFLTIPDELVEAARVDGAGPMRFFFDIILPLSRTNIAALFVIMFAYGWNQYLWPLIVTSDPAYTTIMIGIQRALSGSDELTPWNLVMAMTILAMLPPLAVVLGMQRWFVKGLVDSEK